MNETKKDKPAKSNRQLLIEYSGFGFTLLASAGIATYAGLKIDDRFDLSFPLFVWLLPFVVIILLIIKVIRDTSNK